MIDGHFLRLTFNDALLIYLLGRPDRKATIDRLAAVSAEIPFGDLRTRALVLKSQLALVPEYVWPEFYRQVKWNMSGMMEENKKFWNEAVDLEENRISELEEENEYEV